VSRPAPQDPAAPQALKAPEASETPHPTRHAAPAIARVAFLALAALAALAACGPSASPSPATIDGLPPSPVDGLVLSVDSSGLTQVHGFTLRTTAGDVLHFAVGNLENPTQFPPGHLAEHQANALPVRVYYVPGPEGALLVYRLEDAVSPSPTA
jgi:hypothetical protein